MKHTRYIPGTNSPTRLYQVYSGIKNRCFCPTSKDFRRYGGRGITLCVEWLRDFDAFADFCLSHGWAQGLTIDRIDNDGNYEPNNVQFISRQENASKRETTEAMRESARKLKPYRHLGPISNSHPVVCVETGERWASVCALGRALGYPRSGHIMHYYGGHYKDKTYIYV